MANETSSGRSIQTESFLIAQMPQASGITTTREVFTEGGARAPSSSYIPVPEAEAFQVSVGTFNLAHARSIGLRVWLSDHTVRRYVIIRQKFGGSYPYGTDSILSALSSPISFSATYGRIRNYYVPTHGAGMIMVATSRTGQAYTSNPDDDFEELHGVAAYFVDRVYTQVYSDWLYMRDAIGRGGDLYVGDYSQYGVTLPPDPRTQDPPRFETW